MNLKQMKAIIEKSDPNLSPDDECYQAQLVLLASAEVGPHIRRISQFTDVPYQKVVKFSHFLRKSGVWKGGRIHANWSDPKNGYISFLLDTNIALGFMQRAA